MSALVNLPLPPGWLQPDWPSVPGVSALFTSRHGGVSVPPFDSFNLGDHVRDEPAHVNANRQLLQQHLGVRPVFLQQVHGWHVQALQADTPHGLQADACCTNSLGVACTIMVADCLPLLLAHRSGAVVAAAHAGWRGLLGDRGQGVIERTWLHMVQRLRAQLGAQDESQLARDTQVWLGPCIGPTAFEVGPEVFEAFVGDQPRASAAFVKSAGDRWLADLPQLARQRLVQLGLTAVYGNDGTEPWCTVTQRSQFFSHRRDAAVLGSTGRMAACIWRG